MSGLVRLPRAGAGFGAPETAYEVDAVDGIATAGSGALLFVTSGHGIVWGHPDGTTSELAPAKQFALPANGVFGTGGFGGEWIYVTNLLARRIDRVFVGEAGVTR